MGNKINKTYIIPVTAILGASLLLTSCNNEDNGDKLANTNDNIKFDVSLSDGPKLGKNQEIYSQENITKLNNFSETTFGEIIKYNFENGNFQSQVYSPCSYYSTLGLLANNALYSENNELDEIMGEIFDSYQYPNLKTESLALLNVKNGVDKNKIGKLKNFRAVSFPQQAEEESIKLQERVLGNVLLEPDYTDSNLSLILLNASKFEGVWSNMYDSSLTKDENYTLLDGTNIKTKMMRSGNLAKLEYSDGYEDDDVKIYKKPITTTKNKNRFTKPSKIKNTGDVYIITPKGLGNDLNKNKEIIENISNKIYKYIDEIEYNSDIYDEIYLDMPILDIKSNINLGEVAKNNNKKFIVDEYNLKPKTGINDMQKISSIIQSTSLKLDEEKIEASSASQIEMEIMSLNQEKEILHITADHPFFIVVTARNVENDGDRLENSIIFMSFVNNPTQK